MKKKHIVKIQTNSDFNGLITLDGECVKGTLFDGYCENCYEMSLTLQKIIAEIPKDEEIQYIFEEVEYFE